MTMRRLHYFLFLIFSFFFFSACGHELDSLEGASQNVSPSESENSSSENSEIDPAAASLEQEIFDLINEEREAEGLPALTRNSKADWVARAHSQDMLDQNYFDHINPNGDSPGQRLIDGGIPWFAYGENIAWSKGSETGLAELIVLKWMESSGHRANILDERDRGFTETGIGVALDPSLPLYYYTQLFILPQ